MWQYNIIAQAESASGIAQLFPLVLIFGVFYFLVIRPQQKRQRAHQTLLNALKKDDEVITSGGILGTVDKVDGQVLTLRIARDLKIKVLRTQVEGLQSALLGAEDSAQASASNAKKTKKKEAGSDPADSSADNEGAEEKSW